MLKNMVKQLPQTMYATPKMSYTKVQPGLYETKEIGKRLYPLNHASRILTAYKSGGMEAAKEYIRGVITLAKNEQSMLQA